MKHEHKNLISTQRTALQNYCGVVVSNRISEHGSNENNGGVK
jgi:hypothetical protein